MLTTYVLNKYVEVLFFWKSSAYKSKYTLKPVIKLRCGAFYLNNKVILHGYVLLVQLSCRVASPLLFNQVRSLLWNPESFHPGVLKPFKIQSALFWMVSLSRSVLSAHRIFFCFKCFLNYLTSKSGKVWFIEAWRG